MIVDVGIYIINNIANNKMYIGKSHHMQIRWKEHISLLRRNKHHNNKLQEDWNTYGKDNFTFDLLESCDYCNLDEMESKYIKQYDALINGYNIAKVLDYEILQNEQICKELKAKLLKGMSKYESRSRFHAYAVADALGVSINDLLVIIRDISEEEEDMYDTELRIENEYAKKIIIMYCKSIWQEKVRNAAACVCL